jgi:SET domain-containing protein
MRDLKFNSTPTVVNEYLVEAESSIHGRGLFAVKTIPSDTQLIEYVGDKITKDEARRECEASNHYVFTLDDAHDLNGNVDWNPARWANHSCDPNCEAFDFDGHIWLVTRREIQPGEEITFNYGYDLDDYQEHPCQCGSPSCVGFMVAEELFHLVKRRPGMTDSVMPAPARES